MIVFPAIDLRRGKCVRLRQGKPDEETVFGDDPVAIAQRWEAQGAQWLHIVNLDGAFTGALQYPEGSEDLPVNLQRLRDISATVSIPIQFGGGLRTCRDVELALSLGAAAFIPKPVSRSELLATLDHLLGQPPPESC